MVEVKIFIIIGFSFLKWAKSIFNKADDIEEFTSFIGD